MTAKPKRGRPRKPKPQLAKVIEFDPDRITWEPNASDEAWDAYKVARKAHDGLEQKPIRTFEDAASFRQIIEFALKKNWDAWYLFTVWKEFPHTVNNIEWSHVTQVRLKWLQERLNWLGGVEVQLAPPARVYDLAEYRRFAARVRESEARQ